MAWVRDRAAIPVCNERRAVYIRTWYTQTPCRTVTSIPQLLLFVYFLFSDKGHLIVVLRKPQLCRCGCKGWCTLWPILNAIRCSALCLAVGLFPELRPDNQDWQPEDELRASLAGLALSCTASICMIKADWLEFTNNIWFFRVQQLNRTLLQMFVLSS